MATWQLWLQGLAIVQAGMVVMWLVSLVRNDASLVDRVWGLAFVLLAWVYLAGVDAPPDRAWLVAGLVTAWGVRLTLHITWRNWGKGEDARYGAMRRPRPDTFPIRSLVTVFVLQGTLAWVISLPLLVVATRRGGLGVVDGVAVVVWGVGLYFEAVGDWQLARFLAVRANQGHVMDQGLWRYTRHPNYFGDSVVWVAYGLFAVATGWGGLYGLAGTVVMVLFITRVSGVALTDRRMSAGDNGRKREGYDEYVARTNAFIPGRPLE